MKISIAWVFDHIDADWRKLDIARLAEQFIQTTAEIDRVYKVEIDTRALFCAQVLAVAADYITVHVPELKRDFQLPARADASVGAWFLIASEPEIRWAALTDVGSGKDGLVPEINKDLSLNSSGRTEKNKISLADGSWKKNIESTDYIFELDNKSINHRPDLWGHRGVAREMAAMLGLKLKPLDSFLAQLEVVQYDDSASATADQPFAITIKNKKKCSRFGAFLMRDVKNQPSDLHIALRLARLDSRPIDAIVDATNYVMFDLGHPMHAFDAQALSSKLIEVRDAKKGEKLRLLDGEELTLTPDDLVVSTDKGAVALAGIMGGSSSAVNKNTTELLLEAAWFEPAEVRTTAERAKKRTEASTRFEKNLDPNNNVNALRRFAHLLQDMHVAHVIGKTLTSLGKPAISPVIAVEHAYIESRLGATIAPAQVIEVLQRIEFDVEPSLRLSGSSDSASYAGQASQNEGNQRFTTYQITVPTFRATKDIQGKQDIVEEVGRLFGYINIAPVLPQLQLKPADLHTFNQLNMIKSTCAYVCKMQEVANYNFFDEAFIQSLGWEPGETLAVRSPVSQNWQRLVTSLVPNMLKGIQENCADYDQLRFFELARVYVPGQEITESKKLTGILFEKKKALTFYDGKAVLHDLFERLELPVTWHKSPSIHPTFQEKSQALPSIQLGTGRANGGNETWYQSYQTAQIKHGDTVIGTAGMMPQSFLHKLSEGHAFVFELDADFLLAYRAPVKRFVALPKLQPIVRDISLLLPMSDTVAAVSAVIAQVDSRIHEVTLIDFLEKKEWVGMRAATFRFTIREEAKTLTKQEIDAIVQSVSSALVARGATIR